MGFVVAEKLHAAILNEPRYVFARKDNLMASVLRISLLELSYNSSSSLVFEAIDVIVNRG